MTSTGVCCPRGRFAAGPDKSECLIIISIPTCPQCCPSGQIPAGNGSCCLAANVTSGGECCSGPVDAKNRSKCPVSTRIIPACAAGYTKMPDATCCINRLVSADGKSCNSDRSSKPPIVNVPARPSSTPAQPAPSPRCRPPLVPGAKPGTCTCPGGQRLLDGRCITLKTTPPTTTTIKTTSPTTQTPTTKTPTLKPPKSCPAGEVRTFRGCKKPATTTTTKPTTTTKSPSPKLYGTPLRMPPGGRRPYSGREELIAAGTESSRQTMGREGEGP